MLTLLGHQHRTGDGFATDDQTRRFTRLIRFSIREQLEVALVAVGDGLARPRHPQPHIVLDRSTLARGADPDPEAARLVRQGDAAGGQAVRIRGDAVLADPIDFRFAVVARAVGQSLEHDTEGHVGLRGAGVVQRANGDLNRAAGREDRVGRLRGDQERSKRRVHDRVARDLAIGRVGDLRLDARAEVAAVLVHRQGNAHLRLALGIQPHRALRGLVVTVPVAALAALEPVVPPQGRVVGLLVHDPAHLAVGDGLPEVVACLDRHHRFAALDFEARRRRDDHFKLRFAILLHLEAAGGLEVAALHAQRVVAEGGRGWHREAGLHRPEGIDLHLLAEHHLVVGVRHHHLDLGPVELR